MPFYSNSHDPENNRDGINKNQISGYSFFVNFSCSILDNVH